MVDVAQEAFHSHNFKLASEIYERIISEKGPAAHLLIKLGNSLALDGQLSEAFNAFLKAYRLSKSIDSNELFHLVESLIKLAKDRMLAVSGDDKPSVILEIKDIVDDEPFLCGICLSTVLEPTTIYCGHSFCKKCVDKSQLNICIICGKNPVVGAGFQPNVLLTRLVLKLFPKLEEVSHLKKCASEQFTRHNYGETIALYTKVIELSSDDHTAWSNRSYAFTKLEQYKQALEDAKTAIRLKPQWAKGYFRKGFAEEQLGRTEEAALSYMKCLAIDKSAEQANTNLTQIVHSLLKPKMACDDPKHGPSTEVEPITGLMGCGAEDANRTDGLSKVKALLDQQIAEYDSVLQFESEVRKVDPSSLTVDMFDCSLCYRLLYKPVTTPCGHVFCQHCLDRSMDHSVCCPQCRGNIAEYLAHRNRAITISIQRMLSIWFAKETAERKLLHEQDLVVISSLADNAAEIPIFVCTMAFPTIPCPLHIFEPRYRLMMRQVMESGVRQFGMCLSTGPEEENYAECGTMLEINDLQFFDDGRSVVDTVGGRRFRVMSRSSRDGYNVAKVEFLEDAKLQGEALTELQNMHDELYKKAGHWFTNLPSRVSSRLKIQFGDIPEKDADVQAVRLGPKWVWWVTAILPVDPRAQLSILQMNSLKERLVTIDKVISYLQNRQ